MGTLVFLPWMTIRRPCRVGPFSLKPTVVDPSAHHARALQEPWAASEDAKRLLTAYRTPPDIPLKTATVVHFTDRDVEADLSEEEIASVFTLREALAFSGLSAREFFGHDGYFSTDTFMTIAQRFVKGRGGVSVVTRRRDGNTTIGIPEEYFAARREHHIQEERRFELDDKLASIVLAEMDVHEEFDNAIRRFNEANTDRQNLSEAQELISTVSAFQQFLGIRNGSVADTRRAFVDALAPVPLSQGTPGKARASEKLQARQNLREVWMEDLCTLRGSVGHGHSVKAYPSIWSAMEHLLLAAFVFPLVVKLRLSQCGKWSLSNSDKSGLRLFDLYLESKNVLEAELEEHGVPVEYEWNKIRQDAWYVLREDW